MHRNNSMLFDTKNKNTEQKDNTMSDNQENMGGSYVAPSILSQDLHFEGKIKSVGELQIDGQIFGEVVADQITIGSTGVVEGNIACDSLTVLGKVSGDVQCKSLTVGSPAKIHGNVKYSEIYVEKGALVTAKFELV